jgi:NAD(P)-dependent dehydrogenase (short-subunit alcohol dehydrogenase family)
MVGKLERSKAVVAGAGRGIGRAIAVGLAREGSFVALVARTESELRETQEIIRRDSGEAVVMPADVSRPEEVMKLADRAQDEMGAIDLLVNDAGRLGSLGPAWEADPENWWSDVTVNLFGVFLACRAFLPDMIERDRGRIVNMVGGGTASPFPFASAYASSKAAAMRFTENLAVELDEMGASIRVFALSPGFVKTEMTEQFRETEKGRKWMDYMAERLEEGQDVPPEPAADIIVDIATGVLDRLHGRYLHSPEDATELNTLRDEAEEIVAKDARTLRLRK